VQLEEIRGVSVRGELATTLEAEPVVVPESTVAPEPRRSARLQSIRDVLLLGSDEPATYSEVESTDSESWLGAMRSELKSMDDNRFGT
jgi:hypothetical protein